MSAPTALASPALQSAPPDPNKLYLRNTIRKWTRCRAASGSSTSLAYANGANLTFDTPSIVNGYVEGFWIQVVGNAQYTPANSNPAQALNAAEWWALFSQVLVLYNGTLVNVRPIAWKYDPRVKGYQHFRVDSAGPGFSDNFVQSKVRNTPTVLAAGANAFTMSFFLPLRLHQDSAAGMVPIGSEAGTTLKVELICTPSNNGPDPILNTWNSNGTIVVTGTVTCDAMYRDGETYWSQDKLPLNLNGVPVVQQLTEQQLNPLTAGTDMIRAFTKLLIHQRIISFVVDGNQSTSYSQWSNYVKLGLAKDASGTNFFWSVGLGSNNIPFDHFLLDQRNVYGQDIEDEGVVMWINAGAQAVQDPDSYTGTQALNMKPGRWTSVNHLYNLTSVNGGNGFTPRVETFIISLNDAGFANLQD